MVQTGSQVETRMNIPDSGNKKKSSELRTSWVRWLTLFLACMLNFGNYFCYDNPQALEDDLETKIPISTFDYDLLYSVYSFPNIILPFFGGLLIDKIGVRVALIAFAGLLIIGQSIVAFGAAHKNLALMVAGRVVFGLGGESLTVAQSAITAKWFKGKEVAFAMGATLCVARLGSSLNSFLSPKIYHWTDKLEAPFFAGVVLCVVSWVGSLMLSYIDKKADEEEGDVNTEVEKINFKDFKEFTRLFYLLMFNCFLIYGAFFGLNSNLNKLMVARFGFDDKEAGNYIPIVYLASAVITPFFGLFTDRYGKRVSLMFISSVIFLGDHLFIAFLKDTTAEGRINYGMVWALAGVGLFYSTYAAIFWPCVALVVKENVIGTAYGIITAFQNLMLTIIPLAIGGVQEATSDYKGGYFWTEIMLAIIVVFGLMVTAAMYFEDLKTGKKLDNPATEEPSQGTGKLSISESPNQPLIQNPEY